MNILPDLINIIRCGLTRRKHNLVSLRAYPHEANVILGYTSQIEASRGGMCTHRITFIPVDLFETCAHCLYDPGNRTGVLAALLALEYDPGVPDY